MYCSKCGAQNKDGSTFCVKCGTKLKTINNGGSTSHQETKTAKQKVTQKTKSTGPLVGKADTDKNMAEMIFNRYEDSLVTFLTCIAGIVTSLLAFFTFRGTWVVFNIGLFGGAQKYSLLEFSNAMNQYSGITQYFDAGTTSGLGIMATVATVSYWILIIGAVVSLLVSILILVNPKVEIVVFVPYFIIIAFAVIGLVFTGAMVLLSGYFSATPIPIVMLIIAGIPAVILRFLA